MKENEENEKNLAKLRNENESYTKKLEKQEQKIRNLVNEKSELQVCRFKCRRRISHVLVDRKMKT